MCMRMGVLQQPISLLSRPWLLLDEAHRACADPQERGEGAQEGDHCAVTGLGRRSAPCTRRGGAGATACWAGRGQPKEKPCIYIPG